MRKANFAFLALTILIALAAAPVYAQSFRINAKIPFDFVVGKTTMPAGEYTIDTMLSRSVVRLVSLDAQKAVVALYEPGAIPAGVDRGQASLVFHRYDQTYFLSEVRDGFAPTECLLPTTKNELTLEKNASLHRPDEELVVLAQR